MYDVELCLKVYRPEKKGGVKTPPYIPKKGICSE